MAKKRSGDETIMKTKKKQIRTASELFRHVGNVIKSGKGIEKQVEKIRALPAKYSRNDGIRLRRRKGSL